MPVEIVKTPDFAAFGKKMAAGRERFYRLAMAQIVRDIVQGIKDQKAITGGGFPALEPETIARKGHDRALIDRGALSDEYTYQQLNKWRSNSAEVSIKPVTRQRTSSKHGMAWRTYQDTPRDEVGRELQIEGIDSKRGRKFFRFFGVSADSQAVITALIDQLVQESMEAM